MIRSNWRRLLTTAAVAAGLASGAAWAQAPANNPAVIVLREPGKPDRRCAIESTETQADGTLLHEVRDVDSGERLRVKDNRRGKGTPTAKVVARLDGPDALKLAITTPAPVVKNRVPTTAELAGHQSPSDRVAAPKPTPATPAAAAVQQQIRDLTEALGPSQREMAAMALAVSEERLSPEVVAALTQAARNDPAPSVRICLARCLFRIGDAPQVLPVLQQMQEDADPTVQATARLAVQQLAKPAK